ncbi:MAG: SurA N-terminal domain-containing protein [Bilophila sp.]
MRLCLFLLVLLVLLVPLSVGATESLPPGAVATVNGHVITLRQIEAFHDVGGGALVMAQSPSVELLQEQYGSSLFTLIVQALMQQELERRGLMITDEEVLAAEKEVQSDYTTQEVFEKELQEEYIDLSVWRELMRRRLVTQRFQQRVLRPRFTLSPQEVEAYYTQNKALFHTPEQIEILWIQDTDKETVAALRARWLKEQKQSGALDAKKELSAQGEPDTARDLADTPALAEKMKNSERLRVNPARLPVQLRKDLGSVKQGQATPVRQEGGIYQFAVLCNTFPARKLSVAQALPIIEQVLVEARLEPVYAAWIEETLPQAVIRIAPGLKPGELFLEAPGKANRTKGAAHPQQDEDGAVLPEQKQD